MLRRRSKERDHEHPDRPVRDDPLRQGPFVPAPARDRFGGLDLGSSLAGALAGLGAVVLFGAIVAGTIVLEIRNGIDVDGEVGTLAALAAIGLAIVLSCMVAGWVSGRMARYSGARNGLLAGFWLLVVGGVVAAFGGWIERSYEPFADVARPDWLTGDEPVGGLIAVAAIAVLSLVGAWLSGIAGARYHRKADAALATEVRGERTDVDLRESAATDERRLVPMP